MVRVIIAAAALPVGFAIAFSATPAQADIPCPDGSTVPIGSFCPLFTLPTVTSTVTSVVYTTVTAPPVTVTVTAPYDPGQGPIIK
jgi:hypothetical protein